MKKLVFAAVGLTVAAMTVPAMARVRHIEAAAPVSQYCKMPKASGNGYAIRESWADYYHCWGTRGAAQPAPALHLQAAPPGPQKSEFCKMPNATGNGYAIRESWADYYHCWG